MTKVKKWLKVSKHIEAEFKKKAEEFRLLVTTMEQSGLDLRGTGTDPLTDDQRFDVQQTVLWVCRSGFVDEYKTATLLNTKGCLFLCYLLQEDYRLHDDFLKAINGIVSSSDGPD